GEIASGVELPHLLAVGGRECAQHAIGAAGKDDAGYHGQCGRLPRLPLRDWRDGRHPLLLASPQIERPDSTAAGPEVRLLIVSGAAEGDLAARELVDERRLPEQLAVAHIL